MDVGVVICDHNFTCFKIILSEMLLMHIFQSLRAPFYGWGEGVNGTGTISVHLHDDFFEPSYVFKFTANMLLDMKEHDKRGMQEFQERHVTSDSSGKMISLCASALSTIPTNEVMWMEQITTISKMRRNNTPVLIPFIPSAVLTQTDGGPYHIW